LLSTGCQPLINSELSTRSIPVLCFNIQLRKRKANKKNGKNIPAAGPGVAAGSGGDAPLFLTSGNTDLLRRLGPAFTGKNPPLSVNLIAQGPGCGNRPGGPCSGRSALRIRSKRLTPVHTTLSMKFVKEGRGRGTQTAGKRGRGPGCRAVCLSCQVSAIPEKSRDTGPAAGAVVRRTKMRQWLRDGRRQITCQFMFPSPSPHFIVALNGKSMCYGAPSSP